MNNTRSIFRSYISIPQDHGSWVFILTPLVIGLFAGINFNAASLALIVAAMTAFLIRQPVTIAIKAYAGRRTRDDLPAARVWMMAYGVVLLISIMELVALGHQQILYLGIPAAPVFAWHLWLVSRREERRQAGVEILATGVLALSAPAAYWIGTNSFNPLGWLLWILTWFQSAASIVYAYLRLEQRQWKNIPVLQTRFNSARRAIGYSMFNLALSSILALFKIIPGLLWLPFLLQAVETVWGTVNPAVGAKPVAVGTRQLVVTILFTILFVITWR